MFTIFLLIILVVAFLIIGAGMDKEE